MLLKAICAVALTMAVALPWDHEGSLFGTDTKDFVYVSADQGDSIKFKAKASGAGSNTMTVKVQQMKESGGWKTIDTLKVPVDSTKTDTYVVQNLRDGTTEYLRYRLSRKILTKGINWKLNHDI